MSDHHAAFSNPSTAVPAAGRRRLVVAVVAGSALVAGTIVAASRPAPFWTMGHPVAHALAVSGSGIVVVLAMLALAFTLHWRIPIAMRLTLVVIGGAALQWMLMASDGRGSAAMEERIWHVGHTEFVQLGRSPLPRDYLAAYEARSSAHDWVFPRSKPPGCLQVYRAFDVVAEGPLGRGFARLFFGSSAPANDEQRISALFFVLFPLLTYLTIVPLFFLARTITDERTALLAAMLYGVVPSVALVPMHLDGAVYPLVGTTALALVAAAREGNRFRSAFLAAAGLVLSFGCWITYSLLPIVALAFAFLAWQRLASARNEGVGARVRHVLGDGGVVLVALVGPQLVAVALGYQPIARFLDAMDFHRKWWDGGPHPWKWYLLSPAQFAFWLGAPAAALGLWEAVGLVSCREARRTPLAGWAACTGLTLLACDAFSNARIEASRLWIFWVPVVVVLSAARVRRLEAGRSWVAGVVVAFQLACAIAIRHGFDP